MQTGFRGGGSGSVIDVPPPAPFARLATREQLDDALRAARSWKPLG